jgi:two-component system chemotaxis sensor kinase CheA
MSQHLDVFSESRWQNLKMRIVAIFAGISFPAWSPVYNAIYEDAYDPFWMRLAVSSLCWLVLYLSYTKKAHARFLGLAFNATAFGLTHFMFFLIYKNDLKAGYILAGYCMLFATGAVLNSFRALVIYYISCLAITASQSVTDERNIFLIGGIFCAAAASTISHASIQKLLNYLRASRVQVETVNRSQDNMLNTLGEGYFSFDSLGVCKKVFSQACLSLIETNPADQNVFGVLRMPKEEAASYQQLLKMAFASEGRFELFATLMPKTFAHSQGKAIQLQFRPIIENGSVTEVMVIATDETALVEAKRVAELERRELRMIATIVKERRFFAMFIKSTLESLKTYSEKGDPSLGADDFKRFLHSAKGGTGLFGMIEISEKIHGLESAWSSADLSSTEKNEPAQLARTQARILDELLRGFLTSHTYIFGESFQTDRRIEIRLSEYLEFIGQTDFNEAPEAVRHAFAKYALVPIERYFSSFSELTQKMAKSQKKKMNALTLENGALAIYPERYENLLSSFVHVFTNAVEHGLESLEERRQRGKPEAGQVRVNFEIETLNQKASLVIRVTDDGRGIDASAIRAKIDDEALSSLSSEQVIQRIFDSNFTTRSTVSQTAGRGIGLSALREAAQDLGGTVQVNSVLGQSTEIVVRVPFFTPLDSAYEPMAAQPLKAS